jgi:hypothetical protein
MIRDTLLKTCRNVAIVRAVLLLSGTGPAQRLNSPVDGQYSNTAILNGLVCLQILVSFGARF